MYELQRGETFTWNQYRSPRFKARKERGITRRLRAARTERVTDPQPGGRKTIAFELIQEDVFALHFAHAVGLAVIGVIGGMTTKVLANRL